MCEIGKIQMVIQDEPAPIPVQKFSRVIIEDGKWVEMDKVITIPEKVPVPIRRK